MDSGSTCASPVEEVVEGAGPGLVGLHVNGVLWGELVTISGN